MKILENFCKSQPLCAFRVLTPKYHVNSVQSLPWWSLSMEATKRTTASTRSRPSSGDDYASMGGLSADATAGLCGDGLTPPDLIVIDGE